MKQPTLVSQDELVAFLQEPKSYPHHPRRVRLVQTHASYVFIGLPYVYKVKKTFLAMDFDHYQRPDLSWEIATRSAAALRDSEILRLMDFYKCYRAYVRGKVESLHQAKPEAPETEQKKSRMQAKSYFRLALRYAVCGSKPTVLTIMGRIASGKSTLANALRDELGCEVISSDRVRKELAGLPLYQRGNESSRRRLYSEAMTNKTYKALFQYAGERLDRHENLILDATFSRNKHRNELIRLLHSKGAAYRFIEAQAPDQVIKRRLQHRNGASNEISDARLEDFKTLTEAYEPPTRTGEHNFLRVATDRSITAIIEETLKKLVLAGLGSSA
jgi:uncharacterized protein